MKIHESTMTRMWLRWLVLTLGASSLLHCNLEVPLTDEKAGAAEIALTNSPTDVACLRLTISGASRTDVRKFPLTSGERAVFRLNGLPLGDARFSADAFGVSCDQSLSDTTPSWTSEPTPARVHELGATPVSLRMHESRRLRRPSPSPPSPVARIVNQGAG